MINFRYHVVSLTAVFLALAIGLVVGTAALNGPLAEQLSNTVNGLSNHNKQLRDQVNQMEEEVNRQEDFAVEAAPHLLGGKLAGRRVAVVSLPSGNRYLDGVLEMLTLSGAKITSRIDVQDKLADPANNVTLLDLAHAATPASVTNLPRNSDGVETSSALLAAVLLDRPGSPVTALDRRAVLAAYSSGTGEDTAAGKGGYISVKDPVTEPAEVVVVVAGTPYLDRDAAKKNATLVTLVTQFDIAAPIVVSGAGTSGEGNTITEVRGDPTLSKTISTVDNAQTVQGRLVTVLATVEQLRAAVVTTPGAVKAGHYGIDAGTLMPKLPT